MDRILFNEGAKVIYGIDISDFAVQLCSEKWLKYDKVEIRRMDFGLDTIPIEWIGEFDVVNCFDVAYHVVGDDEFGTFVNNACKALKPGGLLFLNDLFKNRHDAPHVSFRELSRYEAYFRRNKVWILDLMPMYFLLSPIIRVHENELGHHLETIINFMIFLAKTRLGSFVCPLVYVIDSLFTSIPQIKLSSLLMVAIKRI